MSVSNRYRSPPLSLYCIDEACCLLRTLKLHHDRILAEQTAQCREEALLKAGALIQKMKTHLDTYRVDDDTRNRSLYALRQRLKAIEAARTMALINRQMSAAVEAYELFRDEVAGA